MLSTSSLDVKLKDLDDLNRLKFIGAVTFGQLNNHCIAIGMSPEIEEA
jgi:hypothetical protein